MADGSITFSTALDNEQLEKQLQSLKKKIGSTEDKISQKRAERSPLAEQSKQLAATLDAAKARLEYMKSGQEFFTSGQITAQASAVKETEKSWGEVQSKVERYDTAINNATLELDRSKEKAGAIAKELAEAGYNADAMDKATKRANKSMGRFALRVREVVRSALVFTLITQALAKFREWTGKVIKTNAEASASVARLKGALLTLAQPLVNIIIPAFTTVVNVLSNMISYISAVVSALFGTTSEKSAEAAKNLNKEMDAIDGVGTAAKKASKSLAAFDEINKIGGDSATESSAGGASSGAIKPDFSGFDTGLIKQKIDEITTYVSAALIAVGAILLFSGANIPLGLGLLAIGALTLAGQIMQNWDTMSDELRHSITSALVVLGSSLFVLGAILCFSGANIPLGIGLMAVGAASLATAAGLNWDAISTALKGPIGKVFAAVSTALLVLGAILTFSGANIPLGIALMAAGAVGLATVAALNWEAMATALQGPMGGILAMVSAALLVLGIILIFTGAALPLGVALLAVGAAGLVTASALNWGALLEKLQGAWADIETWWGTSVAKFFTIDYWKGIGKNVVDGLIGGIKGIGTKAAEWGSGIVEDIKKALGVHSPSTETESIGNYLVQGLINGITESNPQLQTTLQTVFDGMQQVYNGWQTNFLAGWGEFQVLFSEQWSNFWFKIHLSFANQWNSILDTLQAGINSAITALNSLVAAANALAGLTGTHSAADASRWKTLRDKGLSGMSPEELAEWFAGMKGAYNAVDLNRVGQAVAYVGGLLRSYGYSVSLTEKTDWAASGAYTAADLNAYLQDVKTLRALLLADTELPSGMSGLTVTEANNIERVLIECDDALDRMAKSWFYSGEIGCGEF